jgi:hypothetical protein
MVVELWTTTALAPTTVAPCLMRTLGLSTAESPVPVNVKLSAVLVLAAAAGATPLSVGLTMVNVLASEVSFRATFRTLTFAVPIAATRAPSTLTLSDVDDRALGVSTSDPQRTTASGSKLAPVTVIEKVELPTALALGFRFAIVGVVAKAAEAAPNPTVATTAKVANASTALPKVFTAPPPFDQRSRHGCANPLL